MSNAFWVTDTGAPSPTIVMLDPPLVRLMFAPATKVVWDGPDTVILCAPAPTLTPPAPDIFRSPVNVPEELEVVFPKPVRDTVAAAAAGAEIVKVPADAPTLTIPAPEILRLFPMVKVVDAAPRVFPAIDAVIVE